MINESKTRGEQIFQAARGLETGAKTFTMEDGKSIEDAKYMDDIKKVNLAISKKQEEIKEHIEKTIKTKKVENLEIMPIYKYLLVKPYNKNPYQQIQSTESGLIYDTGGLAPTFKSADSGLIEEESQCMRVGQVLEVGPDVQYVKAGDDIYYKVDNEVPIPFFKQGLIVINEMGVMVVINMDLKQRLIQNQDGR